jgi:cold shock CspA family protein
MDKPFERILGGNEPITDADVAVAAATDVVPKEDKRVAGKIIKVSDQGWGFISSKDIKFTRIFFHWTSLKQDTLRFPDLKNGMKVEFTPVEVEGKGWRAIKIRVIKDEHPPVTTGIIGG